MGRLAIVVRLEPDSEARAAGVIESAVGDLVEDPSHLPVFSAWQELAEGSPRIAREAYRWFREETTWQPS